MMMPRRRTSAATRSTRRYRWGPVHEGRDIGRKIILLLYRTRKVSLALRLTSILVSIKAAEEDLSISLTGSKEDDAEDEAKFTDKVHSSVALKIYIGEGETYNVRKGPWVYMGGRKGSLGTETYLLWFLVRHISGRSSKITGGNWRRWWCRGRGKDSPDGPPIDGIEDLYGGGRDVECKERPSVYMQRKGSLIVRTYLWSFVSHMSGSRIDVTGWRWWGRGRGENPRQGPFMNGIEDLY